MSKIVAFREHIVEELRTKVPEFREVNWYDGVFDEEDLTEWSHKTPAAYVSVVIDTPSKHHTTGERTEDLRCIVIILHSDRKKPRDADAAIWTLCEKVADIANLNTFSDENVGNATRVRINRLIHPELRRQGAAVGIVEWRSNITLGRNLYTEREYVYLPDGTRVAVTPPNLTGGSQAYNVNGRSERETLLLSESDE